MNLRGNIEPGHGSWKEEANSHQAFRRQLGPSQETDNKHGARSPHTQLELQRAKGGSQLTRPQTVTRAYPRESAVS